MPFALSGDCHIYWTAIGRGPPIVLVRGLARSHRYFEPIVPYLARYFRVILFDNRGSGRSDRPAGPYSSDQMADDVVAVMDAAGARSAWILGMSLGGMIALDTARRHPRRVSGLVLGSCTARGRGYPTRVPLWPKLLLAISALLPRSMGRRVQAFVTLSDAFMDRWDLLAAEDAPRIRDLLAHLGAIRSHDSVPYLAQITAPTLVMAGRDDRLVPPDNSRYLASEMPNAELEIVADCGHNIETEQLGWMARRVLVFVDTHASEAPYANQAPARTTGTLKTAPIAR